MRTRTVYTDKSTYVLTELEERAVMQMLGGTVLIVRLIGDKPTLPRKTMTIDPRLFNEQQIGAHLENRFHLIEPELVSALKTFYEDLS